MSFPTFGNIMSTRQHDVDGKRNRGGLAEKKISNRVLKAGETRWVHSKIALRGKIVVRGIRPVTGKKAKEGSHYRQHVGDE